jgi:hypothetical protein
MYNYHETDDQDASIYGMTYKEVMELIGEHNQYFDTDYQSIIEFNSGEAEANGIRYIENA